MSKRQVLMLLGVLVIVLPHLGFPPLWDKIFFAAVGLLVIFVAYKIDPPQKEESHDDRPFMDHHSSMPTQTPTGASNSPSDASAFPTTPTNSATTS